MTTAIATKNQQASMPSLPVDWLLLLGKRRPTAWQRTAEGAMREIAIPLPLGEQHILRQAMAVLEQRLAPADRKVVISALARIANHSSGERTPAQWQMLFEDFWADLQEFSTVHILEAINAHRRESNWFPKVCELRKRCTSSLETDKWRMARISTLLADGPSHHDPEHQDVEAAPGARVRKLSDALKSCHTFEAPPRPAEPIESGPSVGEILAQRDPDAVDRLRNISRTKEQA